MPADAPWIEVPYPPPPARVEVVTPRKNGGDVWVDGQWEWMAGTWKWVAGTWVSPPQGTYFTRWSTVRHADGRLMFLAGTFRDKNGRAVDVGWGGRACPVPSATAEIARMP
ncbi:Hypothetical protein A7982_11912 [Minicystis rosea]|nr:Hypothetical protein A7982_11912 [Minicystis rosea]